MALAWRVREGKEDAARVGERLGQASRPRPDGLLAWLHGASVGESLSLLPLITRLQEARPDVSILTTSGTVTAAELMKRRLPEGVAHQYSPVDTPEATRKFLGHWRPDFAVFVESELWPNLILGAKEAGARLFLVSAKMSQRSHRSWRRWPDAARTILTAYDLILAQDGRSAERLQDLGATVAGVADLKFGAPALESDDDELETFRAAQGGRTILLAASTHPGEEAEALDAFKCSAPDKSLLIIVPRHPDRGVEVVQLARAAGLTVAQRSKGEDSARAQIYVADTLGELGLWFRAARLALIGGSLRPGIGGHNPLEPARLGCPVVSGVHVENWQTAYDDLGEIGGVEFVRGPGDLARVFDRSSEALQAMADRAADFVKGRDVEAQTAVARIAELAS